MQTLDIILRTCDRGNVHAGARFVGAPKAEIVVRCLGSLVRSANAVPSGIVLTVIDDRSSSETVERIRTALVELKHPSNFIGLGEENGGFNKAMRLAFERGRDSKGLVYFIEDDYLHFPEALPQMLASYEFFRAKLGPQTSVALFPEDDPHNYTRMEPARIVEGSDRPWRMNRHTTCSMFIHSDSVRNFWGLFEQMAQYGLRPEINEETTLNRIWWASAGVSLFSPIPSLAFHMQDQPPKFQDWQPLWQQYAQ